LAGQNVRKVDAEGIIHGIAGTGIAGFSGDGGVDTAAQLHDPEGVATDACGNLLICDLSNNRIRKVTFNSNCTDTTGTDTTTSVSNLAHTSIVHIYPNPTYNNITVSSGSVINCITIINLLGQTVFKELYNNGNKEQINIANLSSGVYFIKVNDSYVQKMVKE